MINYIYSLIWKVEGYDCETTFEERKKSTTEILKKYPDKVPILVSRKYSLSIKQIVKQRFMVTRYFSTNNLKNKIKKELEVTDNEIFYLELNGTILDDNINIEEMYVKYKDPDGFLRIFYVIE